MKMKKQLLIISSSYYPDEGGIQTYLKEIIENAPDYQAAVCTVNTNNYPEFECDPYPIYRADNKPVSMIKGYLLFFKLIIKSPISLKKLIIFLSNRDWITRNIKRWKQLFEIVKEYSNIEFVVVATPIPSGALGILLKSQFGIPLITLTHGAELLIAGEKWTTKSLQKLVLKSSDLVIANSEYTLNLSIKYGTNPEKAVMNLLGANTSNFFPCSKDKIHNLRNKLGISDKTKIMLTISHLIPRKGHDNVIKAMKIVEQKIPDICYLIIGNGYYRKQLEELTDSMYLSSKVMFLGFVKDSDLNIYMNLCDLFIMTSRKHNNSIEGFGIVYLEANACKKPVIGGRSGGIPSAIIDGQTGLLVNPESPSDTAEKILRIIQEENLALRLGQEGYNRVINSLNWGNVIRSLFKLIDGTLFGKSI